MFAIVIHHMSLLFRNYQSLSFCAQGANPFKVCKDLRTKLRLNAAMVQIPIGVEDKHAGASACCA